MRTATTVRSRADANVFGKTKSVGPKRPSNQRKSILRFILEPVLDRVARRQPKPARPV